jgi:hypothetical protein
MGRTRDPVTTVGTAEPRQRSRGSQQDLERFSTTEALGWAAKIVAENGRELAEDFPIYGSPCW